MIRVVHPGPGYWLSPIPDPGSRGQKGTQSRILIRNTETMSQNWVLHKSRWPTGLKVFWLYVICPSVADPDPDWIPSRTDLKLLVGSRSSSKINLKESSNYANKCSSCIHIIRLLNISTFFLSTVPGSSQCCGQCCGSETFVSDPISKPDPAWN